MSPLKLIIGNKNYSSWSLRPWLLLKQSGIAFEEIRIAIRQQSSAAAIAQYSLAGRVPVLTDGEITVWDSLAICEYAAERFADKNLWPRDAAMRAYARSISNEMHSGFQALRSHLPMNCKMRLPGKVLTSAVQEDIERIMEIWNEARGRYARDGEFLLGHFTIADAMFAPVCIRFQTYGVKLDAVSEKYQKMMLNLPAMKLWLKEASEEKENIPEYDSLAAK